MIIDTEKFLRALRDLINVHLGEKPSSNIPTTLSGKLSAIIEHVAAEFDFTPAIIISGKRRYDKLTWARHVARYFCRRLTEASLHELGEHFNCDHGTVSHSATAVENRMTCDPVLKSAIARIEADLKTILQIAEENKTQATRFQTANQIAAGLKARSNFPSTASCRRVNL